MCHTNDTLWVFFLMSFMPYHSPRCRFRFEIYSQLFSPILLAFLKVHIVLHTHTDTHTNTLPTFISTIKTLLSMQSPPHLYLFICMYITSLPTINVKKCIPNASRFYLERILHPVIPCYDTHTHINVCNLGRLEVSHQQQQQPPPPRRNVQFSTHNHMRLCWWHTYDCKYIFLHMLKKKHILSDGMFNGVIFLCSWSENY